MAQITISFTPPPSGPTWSNDPDSVTIDEKDSQVEVLLKLTSGSGTLVFASNPVNWNAGTPAGQFTVSAGGGDSITITDADTQYGSFGFTVNVLYNGTPYTSPDPTIINKQPSGNSATVAA